MTDSGASPCVSPGVASPLLLGTVSNKLWQSSAELMALLYLKFSISTLYFKTQGMSVKYPFHSPRVEGAGSTRLSYSHHIHLWSEPGRSETQKAFNQEIRYQAFLLKGTSSL